MEFPDGIMGECRSSYSETQNILKVDAEKGWAELLPAYKYKGIKARTYKQVYTALRRSN